MNQIIHLILNLSVPRFDTAGRDLFEYGVLSDKLAKLVMVEDISEIYLMAASPGAMSCIKHFKTPDHFYVKEGGMTETAFQRAEQCAKLFCEKGRQMIESSQEVCNYCVAFSPHKDMEFSPETQRLIEEMAYRLTEPVALGGDENRQVQFTAVLRSFKSVSITIAPRLNLSEQRPAVNIALNICDPVSVLRYSFPGTEDLYIRASQIMTAFHAVVQSNEKAKLSALTGLLSDQYQYDPEKHGTAKEVHLWLKDGGQSMATITLSSGAELVIHWCTVSERALYENAFTAATIFRDDRKKEFIA